MGAETKPHCTWCARNRTACRQCGNDAETTDRAIRLCHSCIRNVVKRHRADLAEYDGAGRYRLRDLAIVLPFWAHEEYRATRGEMNARGSEIIGALLRAEVLA